jgi:hypothetical protein
MATYAPEDTLVGPIIHEIAEIVRNQIQGVSVVYETVPDKQPEDNSVLIPLTKYDCETDTNGKLRIHFIFGLRHLFRRNQMEDSIPEAYRYLVPYLLAFSAWDNQTLNGLAESVDVAQGGVTQYVESGQVFAALVVNIKVLTEFNIPTLEL